jgi:hypothetical protein
LQYFPVVDVVLTGYDISESKSKEAAGRGRMNDVPIWIEGETGKIASQHSHRHGRLTRDPV